MRPLRIANTAFTLLNVLVWGGLTWVGLDLTRNVASRRIAGHPTATQITYYLHFPAVMLLCSLGVCALALLTKYTYAALMLQVVILITVWPFLLLYGGGV